MRNAWLQDHIPVKVGLMAACPDGSGFNAKFEYFQVKHLPDQRRVEWLKKNADGSESHIFHFFVVGLYQADCLLSHLFINQTTYKQIASEYLQSHARQTDTEILYGTEKIVDKDPFA